MLCIYTYMFDFALQNSMGIYWTVLYKMVVYMLDHSLQNGLHLCMGVLCKMFSTHACLVFAKCLCNMVLKCFKMHANAMNMLGYGCCVRIEWIWMNMVEYEWIGFSLDDDKHEKKWTNRLCKQNCEKSNKQDIFEFKIWITLKLSRFLDCNFVEPAWVLLTNQRGWWEHNSVETYSFCFLVLLSCECDSVEGQKLGFPSFSDLCTTKLEHPTPP